MSEGRSVITTFFFVFLEQFFFFFSYIFLRFRIQNNKSKMTKEIMASVGAGVFFASFLPIPTYGKCLFFFFDVSNGSMIIFFSNSKFIISSNLFFPKASFGTAKAPRSTRGCHGSSRSFPPSFSRSCRSRLRFFRFRIRARPPWRCTACSSLTTSKGPLCTHSPSPRRGRTRSTSPSPRADSASGTDGSRTR